MCKAPNVAAGNTNRWAHARENRARYPSRNHRTASFMITAHYNWTQAREREREKKRERERERERQRERDIYMYICIYIDYRETCISTFAHTYTSFIKKKKLCHILVCTQNAWPKQGRLIYMHMLSYSHALMRADTHTQTHVMGTDKHPASQCSMCTYMLACIHRDLPKLHTRIRTCIKTYLCT